MVYLIVGLTLLCLAAKGFCGKKISCHAKDTQDASLFNLLRMIFCMLIGLLLIFSEGAEAFLRIEGKMLLICIFSGLANAVFMVCWMFAIQRNSMVLVDVALTMGSLIPSIVCALAFDEPLSAAKFVGFALILVATFILAKKGSAPQQKRNLAGLILLLLAMLGDGCIGLAQQIYRQFYTEAGTRVGEIVYPKSIFHFYTYIFAALALFGMMFFYRPNAAHTAPQKRLSPRIVCYIAVLALCLFAANYLQTVATNDYAVSSQLLYPLLKGGCLVSVNFVAMFFFGERMTRRSVLASCIAIGGMVVMSIG